MIINGLKPFMQVILVGDDVTIGKNVASITIVDNSMPEDKRIPYGLQPIVYKIYNASMESDFEMGFEPDINLTQENFAPRSEEQPSELQSLMRISYAVF